MGPHDKLTPKEIKGIYLYIITQLIKNTIWEYCVTIDVHLILLSS